MLHIHGGDILLDRLARAGVAGERLNWKEVLCAGPTPSGLSGDEWRRVRAAFLEDVAGLSAAEAEQELIEQDQRLDLGLIQQDEVVLWFSSDWFCQAILLNLCWRIHRQPRRRARLSLVAPINWPGIPQTAGCLLSQIPERDLPDALSERVELTSVLVHTASTAWEAIQAPSPEGVAALARRTFPELPALVTGLRIHLNELPAIENGLSLSEEQILATVDEHPRSWRDIFPVFKAREPDPWMTDLLFLHRLRRLATGETPLVRWSAEGQEVSRTTAGGEVLAGEQDWCALNRPDRWVGGTHLSSENLWRVNRSSLSVIRDDHLERNRP